MKQQTQRFKFIFLFYILLTIGTVIWSYFFIDANLTLTKIPSINTLFSGWGNYYRNNRFILSGFYLFLLAGYFGIYITITRKNLLNLKNALILLTINFILLITAYPATTYDEFNYITTAKVLYTYHENPYIVMPVEIPNEPNLAFTRAANKVALYGPAWIILTAIPHYLGFGSIWLSIITFKVFVGSFYLILCMMIIRWTKQIHNLVFFAFNPLVLNEILVSGHNDIVMMVLAISGIYLITNQTLGKRIIGWIAFCLSLLIKGATLAITPTLFFPHREFNLIMKYSFWIMLALFLVATPLREELYPWYAVWFLSIAAFLPHDKNKFIINLCIAFSIGLELRAVPYMIMGYYEGIGPLMRTVVTIIPILILFGSIIYGKLIRYK